MTGRGRRLLVVDDDELIRLLLSTMLELDHWDVRLAGSVAEGRSMLAGRPEVVVLDDRLPDGSGLDLAQEVHGAHVVLYSGSGLTEAPPGVDAVVSKGS